MATSTYGDEPNGVSRTILIQATSAVNPVPSLSIFRANPIQATYSAGSVQKLAILRASSQLYDEVADVLYNRIAVIAVGPDYIRWRMLDSEGRMLRQFTDADMEKMPL